jgi:Glycosyltransferase family 87
VLTAIGGPWADESINDLFIYRTYADLFLGGTVPYHDVAFEYPPLALVPIVLGGVLGTGETAYAWTFGVLMLGAALAVQQLAAALAPDPAAGRRAAWVLAALPLLLGAMVRTHFDLVPVALLLGALLLLVRDRPVAGLALLGVATMTKAFPIVVLPVALAWLLARGERRAALRGTAAFAAVCLALALPFAGGLLDTARFHRDRPVQIESAPAGVVLLTGGGEVTGDPIRPDRFKSNGIEGGGAGTLAAIGTLLMLAALAAITVRTAAAPRPGPGRLLLGAFAAVLAFVALGKVLSPQYLIWLVPLAAVAWSYGARAAPALVGLAALLTLAEFPARYWDVVAREPGAIALVVTRNALLLAALVVLIARPAGRGAAAARWRRPASAATR